jgi:hypothetical protein
VGGRFGGWEGEGCVQRVVEEVGEGFGVGYCDVMRCGMV